MSLKIFENQEFVNPVELGKAIGIDTATVRKWIAEGWLPAVDMRSPGTSRPRWRISEEGYEAFVKKRSNTPPPTPQRRRRNDAADLKRFFTEEELRLSEPAPQRRRRNVSDGLEKFFPEMGPSNR